MKNVLAGTVAEVAGEVVKHIIAATLHNLVMTNSC